MMGIVIDTHLIALNKCSLRIKQTIVQKVHVEQHNLGKDQSTEKKKELVFLMEARAERN